MTYSQPTNYNAHFDVSISPFISPGDTTAISNIVIDSDSVADQGPDVTLINGVRLKARAGNAGIVYFGFDSTCDSTEYELSAGDAEFVQVQNLNHLWFFGAAGDQICALKA